MRNAYRYIIKVRKCNGRNNWEIDLDEELNTKNYLQIFGLTEDTVSAILNEL
jgi:hypothetical protein